MATPRAKGLTTKVTSAEYAMFEALAGDQTVSGWARDTLLRAATRRPAEQVLLEEVLALRTILLNLHFAIARGVPPTADDMRQLIDRADHEKAEKAHSRLSSARARPVR